MSEKEIGNIMVEQESYMSKGVILLLLVGLLLIIIYSCYRYRKNSKKCKKGCKCSRYKSCTKESYRTLTPSNDVFVLQTTDTGDLSKINITPIIKNWIDDKSVNKTASFSIKELTTVENVKGGQLCIGGTCLTEADLLKLKMITTSNLTNGDITLLKAMGTGVNMKMNASGSTGSQLVGWFWGGTGNSYIYPTMDGADGYSTKANQKSDKIFSFIA